MITWWRIRALEVVAVSAWVNAVCRTDQMKLDPLAWVNAVCQTDQMKLVVSAWVNAVCRTDQMKLDVWAWVNAVCQTDQMKLDVSVIVMKSSWWCSWSRYSFA